MPWEAHFPTLQDAGQDVGILVRDLAKRDAPLVLVIVKALAEEVVQVVEVPVVLVVEALARVHVMAHVMESAKEDVVGAKHLANVTARIHAEIVTDSA